MNWHETQTLVLGLGDSGEAAALKLHELGSEVTVRDEVMNDKLEQRAVPLRNRGVRVELGPLLPGARNAFDLAVLSPGIDPRKPFVSMLQDGRTPLWSELEFAYRFCECPIVAITGTNGKTTTTELVHAVLEGSGKRTMAAGNIGKALTQAVSQSNELDVMVVEVSSFQLEQIIDFRPRVAAFLNITPDHMDRYDSMKDYLAAKMRIFENQEPEDYAILNASLGRLKTHARQVTFSARGLEADYTFDGSHILWKGRPVMHVARTKLRGVHNVENAMVALAVGHIYGVQDQILLEALGEYQPAAHRCEFVAEIEGVAYINDSKATNPDAVAVALESQDAPVILIAGGKDKGFEFDAIASLVAEKTRLVILIGETADKIASQWIGANCVKAPDFLAAVTMAADRAHRGDVVLLSPACSSFDMFKNYSDRGDQFKQLVHQIQAAKES